MINISDYVKKNKETGDIEIDNEAYEAALNSEIDKERTKASKTASDNAEKKLRKELEAKLREEIASELNMSNEEKLKKERETFVGERKAFNVERVKFILSSAGMSAKQVEKYVEFVTDDEKSIEKAQDFAEIYKTELEASKQAWTSEIQAQMQQPQGGAGGSDESGFAKWQKQKNDSTAQTDFVDLSTSISQI